MLDVKDIKNLDSEDLLITYEGNNPYINYMKKKLQTEKKYFLTNNQSNYIRKYFNFEPKKINKVIELTNYYAEELKEEHKLKILPKKIFIDTLLAESDKAMHVICKLFKNQTDIKLLWVPKTQILDDIHYEELEIDIDFDKYQKLDKRGWKAFKHQEDGIKFLLRNKKCILADDMGLGKVIANDVPVLTPNGWVLHGSLKKGDYVIGLNGKPTKVLETYPNPLKDYYNITFTDGTVVESCDEHLWAVQTNNHRKRGSGFKVKSLKELMGDLTYGNHGNTKWFIPMVKPVEFNEREISIDPYLLGCLLGDGSISQRKIILSTIDEELLNECSNRLPKDYFFEKIDKKDDYLLKQRITEHTIGTKHSVIKNLESYNLMGTKSDNKFIPEDYKYNTKNIRLEILQGLLDTDGYCSKQDGTIQFYSTSKQLSDDVKELVQSFGGVAKETNKIGKYKKPDGFIVECKKCYILTINLPEDIIPFKLQRKINNMKTNKKYLPYRGIKSIEFSRRTLGQCIRVESDDHLYVMDKYVVTHNTYQSIVAALECNAERVLIICPSSLKINWKREVENFCDSDEVSIISGNFWNPSRFTIVNYDILKNFHTIEEKNKKYEEWELRREIADFKPDLIILDEAHYIKNHKSKRGAILKDLSKNFGCDRVWLLTGTPIANRPMDYYNLLSIIDSPITNNWVHYAKTYCDGKRFRKGGKFVWVTKGASNLDELASKTKRTILRRKKENVLDLPEKLITSVYLELQNEQGYKSVWEDYLTKRKLEGKKGNPAKDLVEMTLLRTFIAMETVPYSIEKAEEALELDKKVIIFCNFNDEMDAFIRHFGDKCVCVRGGMTDKQKQLSVDRFQEDDKCKVFVGQIKAAGVGLTLTKAEIVIMNSLDWVPGNHEQSEDRAYRIGQKEIVNIYYMLIDNTIDTLVWDILNEKKKVIGTIMGEDDIITEFLKKLDNGS
jgi:hypothetical protein